MWFNSMTTEEPHQGLKFCWRFWETGIFYKDSRTGAARSSSVRGMSCSLQWGNERNPYRMLQVSCETASVQGEEGGDDARSAWPSDALGYTRGTMEPTMRCQAARRSQSHQTAPQFRLRSATRPHEVGIASNRGSAMPR